MVCNLLGLEVAGGRLPLGKRGLRPVRRRDNPAIHQRRPPKHGKPTSGAGDVSLPVQIVAARDFQQALQFVGVGDQIATVPPLDQPHEPCHHQTKRRDGGKG